MDPDIVLVSAILAAAPLGAPPLAFAVDDALLLALLVGLGAAAGIVVGAGASRVLGRRRAAAPPRETVVRRPIRPSRATLGEDPIVVSLGVGDDEALRARRRRRPIGAGLHTPPGESAPPPT